MIEYIGEVRVVRSHVEIIRNMSAIHDFTESGQDWYKYFAIN